jgi:hypothetical protein
MFTIDDDWMSAIWMAASIVLCCMWYQKLVDDRIREVENRVRVVEDRIRVRKVERKAILPQYNQ